MCQWTPESSFLEEGEVWGNCGQKVRSAKPRFRTWGTFGLSPAFFVLFSEPLATRMGQSRLSPDFPVPRFPCIG
jgi:hypothetical protein